MRIIPDDWPPPWRACAQRTDAVHEALTERTPPFPPRECASQLGSGECIWYGVCQETLPGCSASARAQRETGR